MNDLRHYISLVEAAMTGGEDILPADPELEAGDQILDEVAPDAPGAADWIAHRTPDFKDRYGKRWKAVLYGKAWKLFGKKAKNHRD